MTARMRKFWGWGYADEIVGEQEAAMVRAVVAGRFGALAEPLRVPRLEDITLPPSRLSPPDALSAIITSDPAERVGHAYGQSFADIVRAFQRSFDNPPDLVAYPRTTDQVAALLDWADGAKVAVIPYGGGTSVCGGVEPDVGEAYAGTLTVDLSRMNRVLEVDRTARAALIEAGATGPEFEAALKPHGLTLRHFPQSFALATLGGMIVTRSGGHFATLYTHIDAFVQAVEMVTPRGVMQTRRLPASGAGPDPHGLVCGSEGTLGIVTKAWMRLQDVPVHRSSATVRFSDVFAAARAVRAIAQSGLNPANCRLLDPAEAAMNGLDNQRRALLVLGLESADHPQDARLDRALEIAADHGGTADPPKAGSDRSGTADAWRTAFLRMPYWREVVVPHGVIVDTFETACSWTAFDDFYTGVIDDVGSAMRQVTGRDGVISCRFTHVYPDGPAPYFTFSCPSSPDAMLDHWRQIKLAANDAVVRRGGTITHHHAVGRDHRVRGYDAERPEAFARALQGAKAAVDPAGILNPGVLIDPDGSQAGPGGVLAGR